MRDWDRDERHPACRCGCGELADECGNGILDWVQGR